MKPKDHHFQAISQANARTVRWPWFFLLGFWLLIRNLIIGWFSPRPPTQHTIPRRKPLRRSADWELRLAKPRDYRRPIAVTSTNAGNVGWGNPPQKPPVSKVEFSSTLAPGEFHEEIKV